MLDLVGLADIRGAACAAGQDTRMRHRKLDSTQAGGMMHNRTRAIFLALLTVLFSLVDTNVLTGSGNLWADADPCECDDSSPECRPDDPVPPDIPEPPPPPDPEDPPDNCCPCTCCPDGEEKAHRGGGVQREFASLATNLTPQWGAPITQMTMSPTPNKYNS